MSTAESLREHYQSLSKQNNSNHVFGTAFLSPGVFLYCHNFCQVDIWLKADATTIFFYRSCVGQTGPECRFGYDFPPALGASPS